MRIGALINYDKPFGCPPTHLLSDEEGQRIGPLEVIPTQGHTPGSVSFYWRERGIVAVGDAILTWPVLGGGWPGFNLDEARYRRSLRRIAELEPRVILTGHGLPVTQDASAKLKRIL
jgi:glyoxylase-like metal-dependent hydrolase (beta-lactamase superfamily II)